jgi:hypothetical protein
MKRGTNRRPTVPQGGEKNLNKYLNKTPKPVTIYNLAILWSHHARSVYFKTRAYSQITTEGCTQDADDDGKALNLQL